MGKRTLEAEMSEQKVMALSGLSEEAIRPIRVARLEKDADWFRDDARMIQYTKKGLARLQEALGGISIAPRGEIASQDAKEPLPIEKKTAAVMDVVDFRIERVCPNPTWIQARMQSGELVNVRVKNNERMARGMLLADCRHDGRSWVYGGKRA